MALRHQKRKPPGFSGPRRAAKRNFAQVLSRDAAPPPPKAFSFVRRRPAPEKPAFHPTWGYPVFFQPAEKKTLPTFKASSSGPIELRYPGPFSPGGAPNS